MTEPIPFILFAALRVVFGDLEQAADHWTKSRDLFARIGMPHRVKKVQGWLDEAVPR